jgi:hypothetical protein
MYDLFPRYFEYKLGAELAKNVKYSRYRKGSYGRAPIN